MTQEILIYQDIDAKLRKLERQLADLPERKQALEMQNILKNGQARLASVEANSQKAIENYNRASAYYNDLILKVDAVAKSVDGSDLEKIRELQRAKNNFYQMVDKLEKELVKVGTQLTTINNEYNSIIRNAKTAKANLDKLRADFAAKKQKLEPEIEKLKAELGAQAKKVDKKLLEKYNQKRESKFPVFVKNIGGTCGGCRMAISASKMREFESLGYIECENCGRYITAD